MMGIGGGMPSPEEMAKLAREDAGRTCRRTAVQDYLAPAGGLPPTMPGLPPKFPGACRWLARPRAASCPRRLPGLGGVSLVVGKKK